MILRRALFALLVFALAGVAGSATPGLFRSTALAQGATFSCFFAGLNQYNNIINTGIQCTTPAPLPSGAFIGLACAGPVLCAPSGGPTPSVNFTQGPTFSSVTVSGLTSGNCVQATTGGLLTSAAAACGGGTGTLSNLVCSAPIVCSPSSGPSPSIAFTTPTPLPCPTAGTNVLITGAQMPSCSISSTATAPPQATPSPAATSTGCATLTWTGSFPYTNGINVLSCPQNFNVSVTTAGTCSALASCGTVSYSFPSAYGTQPRCTHPGVQDTTSATQLWAVAIDMVSTSGITFAYGPLAATGTAHSLVLTFTCGV